MAGARCSLSYPMPTCLGTVPSSQAVPWVTPSLAAGFQRGQGAPRHRVKGLLQFCYGLNRLLIGFQHKVVPAARMP